jgi:DNA invertase Pin-like site-specific DNA recombinase
VPYYRVSTDDKDQNPERQAEIVEPWAEREGVTLLDAVIDEGTSASKTNPLDRKKFIAACERAKASNANAIVVECSDRFSRQGAKLDAWTEVEVERRFGLKVFRADKPLELHGTMAGDLTDSVHAETGRAWVKGHASKVRSGMARRKKEGARFGRPAKPLSPTEIDLVLKLRSRKPPVGWGRCARAVCDARAAHRIVDPDVRRKAEVSGSHVRRAVLALPKVETVQKVSKAG